MMYFFPLIFILTTLLSAILIWGKSGWHQYISTLVSNIKTSASSQHDFVNLEEINTLPDPVKNYFKRVLTDGAPIIKHVSISQTGGFRTRPEMTGWSRMKASQFFSTMPRAFVWDASISVISGLSVKVCDSYISGQGAMKVKLFSIIPLIDLQKQRELNEAALQRYLAEAVWFPTALLPSQGVAWKASGENKAEATISDCGSTVSLEFEFNEKAEVISVYSPGRYRETAGKFEPTPWKGYFSNYLRLNDMFIPQNGEVEWHLTDRIYPYWRASLSSIKYE